MYAEHPKESIPDLKASLTFGRPNLDILFVVGGLITLDEDTGQPDLERSKSGFLFMITDIGAKGIPEAKIKI